MPHFEYTVVPFIGRSAFFMQFDQMVFSREVSGDTTVSSMSAATAVQTATGTTPPIPTTVPPPISPRTLVYSRNAHICLGVFVEDDGQHIIVERADGTLEKFVSSAVDLVQE